MKAAKMVSTKRNQARPRTPMLSFVSSLLLFIGISNAAELEPAGGSESGVMRMPLQFVAGSYEVIGRYPDSEQTYSGTVEISLSDAHAGTLSVTRNIGDTSVEVNGLITTKTTDGIAVLRVEFEGEAGIALEATYLIESDLDNYARLTGYVYAKDGTTSLPGLEALFHDHYKAR